MGGEILKKKSGKSQKPLHGFGDLCEAIRMFLSGMSGLYCTPVIVIGCVQAGAAGPAVKSIVKEIPALGFWEA